MTIGEFIKKLRKEKKITLKELSNKMGNKYSYSYLSQIENGLDGRKPTPEMLAALSEALDHDYYDLMSEAGYLDTRSATEIIEEVESVYNINFPDLMGINSEFRGKMMILDRIFFDLMNDLRKSTNLEDSKNVLEKYKTIINENLQSNDLYEILTSSQQVKFGDHELNDIQKQTLINVIKAIL